MTNFHEKDEKLHIIASSPNNRKARRDLLVPEWTHINYSQIPAIVSKAGHTIKLSPFQSHLMRSKF